MELKLKISLKNHFPKRGIFIKSASVEVWLDEIQKMDLSLDQIRVYPVPSLEPNGLFGCLLIFAQNETKRTDIRKNSFLQLVENKLFIPENTIVEPQLVKAEWNSLFSENYHFLHPEIGLAELNEEVNWLNLLNISEEKSINIIEPSKSIYIPQRITSMRYDIDPEKVLESLEKPFSDEEAMKDLPFDMQEIMKGNQQEMDKFLEFFDKNPELALKMAIPLDTLGSWRGDNEGSFSFGGNNVPARPLRGGSRNTSFDTGSSGGISGQLILKIVFVLFILANAKGCSRSGLNMGANPVLLIFIVLLVLGFIVALALNSSNSSGITSSYSGSINSSGSKSSSGSGSSFLIDHERFASIQSRYEKLAQECRNKKDYTKAAQIYMRLLKNHRKAAETLEEGQQYNEAAAVYLKYIRDKTKAAECYEKGHSYQQAIEIHKEFNNSEKVGDLYLILKDKKEADKYFNIVIENYKTHFQYVKASLLYSDKIGDVPKAQELLIKGWKTNKDASNCLNNYFANIQSVEHLSKSIAEVYTNEVDEINSEMFLNVIKHEFKKHEKVEDLTRDIAYEIVAKKIDSKPDIASELIHFNQNNKTILKDVMKYKFKSKRKKQ